MANEQDHFALEWIKSDLLETLNQARQALEEVAEGEKDVSRLRVCVTALHQTHGTLVMLELPRVTQFADHLEQLAQAMFDSRVKDFDDAAQTLMQGMLELPGFLDEIQQGGDDAAQPVIPVINEIRKLLGLELLEVGVRLRGTIESDAVDRFQRIDGIGKAQKIRSAYQQVLLAILKGEDRQRAVTTLRKVAQGLYRICEETPHAGQWQAFGEFVHSLARQTGPLDAGAVKLLRRADAEIRGLAKEGLTALQRPTNIEFVRHLLEAAESREYSSTTIADLKSAVIRNEDSSLSMSGRQALGSAADSLREDLAALIDQIDLNVRAQTTDAEQLTQVLAPLKRVGSTLSLLGLESSRAVVFDLLEQSNDALDNDTVEPTLFFGLASALVQVDENLSSLSQHKSEGQVERITSDAQFAVAREARAGLDDIKQAIVTFVASQWDVEKLAGCTEKLRDICGVLDVIPLPRAARLLTDGANYLEFLEQGGSTPSWEQLDHFADAISGIDYYLERMSEESRFGRDEILDLAERSIEALDLSSVMAPELDGSATEDELKLAAESASAQVDEVLAEFGDSRILEDEADSNTADETIADAHSVDVDLSEIENARDELAAWNTPEQSALNTETDSVDLNKGDFNESNHEEEDNKSADVEPLSALGDIGHTPDLVALEENKEPHLEREENPDFDLNFLELDSPDDEADSSAENETEDLTEDLTAEAKEAEPVARTLPEGLVDSYDTDEEIVEIFCEEVDEVLAAIDEALPLWQANTEEESSLKDLRRAFHTLKGSGRIVGAKVLGELAWSIENMLNRVLDHTVAVTPAFSEVVNQARLLMPALRDDYEAQRIPAPEPVAELMEKADLLSSGEILADALVQHAETILEATDTQELAAIEEAQFDAASGSKLSNDSDETIDDDAIADLRLFLEEAEGYMQVLRDSQFAPRTSLDEDCLRSFHTLVGSAAMAGVDAVAALAQPTYDVAKAFHRQGGYPESAGDFVRFMNDAVDALQETLDALAAGTEPEDYLQLIVEADRLMVLAEQSGDPTADLIKLDAVGVLLDVPEYLSAWFAGTMDLGFSERLTEALQDIEQHVKELQTPQLEQLVAGLTAAHDRLAHMDLGEDGYGRLRNAHERLLQAFDALAADQSLPDMTATLSSLELITPPGEQETDSSAEQPEDTFSLDLLNLEDVQPPSQTPKESADLDLNDLSSDRESVQDPIAAIDEETLEETAALEESEALEEIEELETAEIELTAEAANQSDSADLEEFSLDHLDLELGKTADLEETRAVSAPANSDLEQPFNREFADETVAESVAEVHTFEDRNEEIPAVDAMDLEILEVFFEEADEITDALDTSINCWRNDRDNRIHLENMLRGLHTLKGGARLAGLTSLGDVTHQFESFLSMKQSSESQPGDEFFDDLVEQQDHLAHLVNALKADPASEVSTTDADQQVDSATDLVEPENADAGSDDEGSSEAKGSQWDVPDVKPREEITVAPIPLKAPAPQSASTRPEVVEARSASEAVRVGAGLLEALVNLAGESSIVRARIEQGLGDFTSALDEMETTIDRLREQLRRLEIETEAQILSRHEHLDGPDYDNFDPLEMDRYSQLQQLSRSLSESASDMLDLKDTLLYKARESETLLMQQARINTELQEGLMRTRMVPFSRLLPRLRRMVRQTAKEVGKPIEFEAYNVEGELDRNLLERMIAPLEHMLRNSVDHGIEGADLRRQFNKPEAGQIELRLTREGGDVMIEISDDGAGIDVESVREKAVERGLMEAGADLRDDEILQFVLAPGFSTAKSVTQISGRGVGLDVVHSEVKQLGGSINIVSRPGRGTRFILRVPFTVSVNRALMVGIGDDLYAIPLNTIEGIVLLGPRELEKLYEPGNKVFEYAGASYDIQYLGHFLGREYRGNPQQQSAPVVLVRSGDRAVAVHVDAVQGSREIVVKSLGPQFAGLGGISGATILGDGSVVVILDLLALIRARPDSRQVESAGRKRIESRARCVMVVDDSVTVRKVTSRLLERQGMEVLLAKDGVEAVAMLQERRPDIMLLDIEMPRMDGFEVARQVRHDDRLRDLPVVMISSRTGDKHQEHAQSIGVNRFLGKPFQESELLSTIEELVTIT